MYLSKGISTGVVLLSAIFLHSGFPDIIVWIEKISLNLLLYKGDYGMESKTQDFAM